MERAPYQPAVRGNALMKLGTDRHEPFLQANEGIGQNMPSSMDQNGLFFIRINIEICILIDF